MTKQNGNKVTIKYKEREYEIEKKKEKQKVKPKGVSTASADDEITVKNYREGFWTHSCECNGEKIKIKWGKGKHITIWGGGSTSLVLFGLSIWRFVFQKNSKKKENKEK